MENVSWTREADAWDKLLKDEDFQIILKYLENLSSTALQNAVSKNELAEVKQHLGIYWAVVDIKNRPKLAFRKAEEEEVERRKRQGGIK